MTNIGPIGLSGLDALYYELDQMQDETRKAAREQRHEAQQAQIEALMDQADHTEQAALLQGLGSICSGATQMLGVLAQGEALGRAQTAETEKATSLAMSEGTQAQKGFEAMGQIQSGVLTAAAGSQTAAGQRSAARATAAASRAQDAQEVEQDAKTARERTRRQLETAQEIARDLRSTLVRA